MGNAGGPPHGTRRAGADPAGSAQRYGDAVARSLGLTDAPALRTHRLSGAQIGMTRISCGADQFGMTPRIPPEDTFIVALYQTELPYHELWSRGRRAIAQGYAANTMRIVNLEAQYSALIAAPHESVGFYIPRAVLDSFAEENGLPRIGDLSCAPGTFDPVVAGIGGALLPAFARPEEANWLFLDEMALALCTHVTGRYGVARKPIAILRGGLSHRDEQRAIEFLAAHFAGDVSVADVAAQCGLSRGYFLRAFKASTGTTPHRWLQAYRIERAKALLLDPSIGLADIALKCGFADQSHLTRVFAQHIGMSPGAWRRAHAKARGSAA